MSSPIYNLVVEAPGTSPRYYQLGAKVIGIGREDRNVVIIEVDAVSSRHCELRRKETTFEIVDLGSTNGTRLNGESVGSSPRELRDGDTLLLGLSVKARFIRVVEISDRVERQPIPPGSLTRKLEREDLSSELMEINPVAAAVAKASRPPTAK